MMKFDNFSCKNFLLASSHRSRELFFFLLDFARHKQRSALKNSSGRICYEKITTFDTNISTTNKDFLKIQKVFIIICFSLSYYIKFGKNDF